MSEIRNSKISGKQQNLSKQQISVRTRFEQKKISGSLFHDDGCF